jgi:hypothetical protein
MNRIALVWATPVRLASSTIRYELFYRGFQDLGWEPVVVTTRDAALGFPYPVHGVDDAAALQDPECWASLDARVALIITWLRMRCELAAMRHAGVKTIAITDSDGYATPRSHPREWLRRMLLYQPTPGLKLRAAGFWLRRYLFHGGREVDTALESLRQSDGVVLHSPGAVSNLRRLTDRYGEPGLAERLHVVPYPVDESFCNGDPLPAERANRVVAVSRWDDPQKDAALMVRTLDAYYAAGGSAEVVLVGRQGEGWFGRLAHQIPKMRYVGILPPAALRGLFRTSRVILFTSRWESGPVAAGEALACGCTLVGPPLLNFVTYHLSGPFGEASRTRSPRELAAVLSRELRRWDRGERQAAAIAAHWRARLHPVVVCKQLLGLVGFELARRS